MLLHFEAMQGGVASAGLVWPQHCPPWWPQVGGLLQLQPCYSCRLFWFIDDVKYLDQALLLDTSLNTLKPERLLVFIGEIELSLQSGEN